MNKCPKCELNYKDENEEYCSICKGEIPSEIETADICIVCGSAEVMDGEEVCENCYRNKILNNDIDKTADYGNSIDSYRNLMDSDVPDCDLETINRNINEFETDKK